MDIFTTILTRVVPVPIKPTDLKVKALSKGVASKAVSDDIIGLEDQPVQPLKAKKEKSSDKESNSKQSAKQAGETPVSPEADTGQHIDVFDDSENSDTEKDGKHQLDIFI